MEHSKDGVTRFTLVLMMCVWLLLMVGQEEASQKPINSSKCGDPATLVGCNPICTSQCPAIIIMDNATDRHCVHSMAYCSFS